MAVTRIKNNQITDNTIEYQKIKDGTLVGTKFNPDLTLNSNINIVGNLQVTGATTTITSINTFINDPLVIFNNGYVGTPSYDVGMLVNRNLAALGTYGSLNTAWVWSESDKAFIAVLTTETGSTTGSINRSFFANVKVGNLEAASANLNSITMQSLTSAGVLKSLGNIVAASGTTSPIGDYTYGALVVAGSGALGVGGNLNVNGLTNLTGNLTAGNIYITGSINATVGAVASNYGIFYGNAGGIGALYAGTTTYVPSDHTVIQLTANINNYAQLNFQNSNSGAKASGDIVVTADNGNDDAGYIDLGINSSTFNDPGYPGLYPNDGYLIQNGVGSAGNLVIISEIAGTAIKFRIGGYNTDIATVTDTGFRVNTSTTSTSTSTGALIVDGGLGVAGNIHAAAINNTPIGNTKPSTGYFTNVTANVFLANNFSSTNVSITGGNITGVSGLTVSNITVTTFTAGNISTSNLVVTGGYIQNISNISVSGNTIVGGNLFVSNNSTSFSSTSGAFVIVGGAGIGGNLYVGGNTFITGNLTVYGEVTSINTTQVYIKDQNITIANGAPTAFAANGAGITIDGAGATITYINPGDYILFNKEVVMPTLNVQSNVYLAPTHQVVIVPGQTGYMDNMIIGGNTASNVTSTNLVATTSLIVNASKSIQLTGGTGPNFINNVSIGLTTPVTANFSFANVSALTVSSNTSLTNTSATTLFTTNLSTANAQITGGNITSVNNVYGTTAQFTNFSSGNVIIGGGTVNNTSIGLTTPAAANITVLNVSNDTKLTTANATSVQITNLGDVTPGTAVFTTLNTTSTTKIGGNLVLSVGTTNPVGSSTQGALILTGEGGAAIGGNVTVQGGLYVNYSQSAAAGHETIIKGVNDSTLFWAKPNASYDQVVVGGNMFSSTVDKGAKLAVYSTDSMLLPKGYNSDRPSSVFGAGYDVAGMIRFSLTSNSLEYYDGSAWQTPGINFTIISSTQFAVASGNPNGNVDGINAIFVLPSSTTTNGCIVSINGVVQLPTTAYSIGGVSNDTLTFTEPPALGDVIDVRILTTTVTPTSVSSPTGYFSVRATNSNVAITTGPSTANDTVIWVDGGAEVNLRANSTVASSGVATVVDSFSTGSYSSAEYTVTATIRNTAIRQISKVTLVSNGTATSILQFGDVCTAGNTLVTFTGGQSGATAQLKATTTNNNTILRIAKMYQAI